MKGGSDTILCSSFGPGNTRAVNQIRMMAVEQFRRFHDMMDTKSLTEGGGASQTIHSGHFMVSRVHDHNKDEDDEEGTTSPFNDHGKGFDFLTANREICSTYNFNGDSGGQPANIDASLTKLFECMTLAYSGKITSPKWKQFRGLHLSQKQRIRLNNLIWREWHLQYIYGKRPMVCQFATPLSDNIHSKPEAVVLEGKYWKRQLDTVTAEYKKWRRFFKERICQQQLFFLQENINLSEHELLERVKDLIFVPHITGSIMCSSDLNLLNVDLTDMDLTNDLFNSLNQPFAFPNPRELNQLGCADLIQPGLVQLQPNFEDMDIDCMQEFLNLKMPGSSTFTANSSSACDLSLTGLCNTDVTLESFLGTSVGCSSSSLAPTDTNTFLSDNYMASFLPDSPGLGQAISFELPGDDQYQLDTGTSFPAAVTQPPAELYSQVSAGVAAPNRRSTPMSSSELLAQLVEHQQQSLEAMLAPKKHFPQQTSMQGTQSLNQEAYRRAGTISQNPLLSEPLSYQHPPTSAVERRSENTNRMVKQQARNTTNWLSVESGVTRPIIDKRQDDYTFVVPKSKPAVAQRKSQLVAIKPQPVPQPTSPQETTQPQSSTLRASYLAELLRSGTYSGAVVNVKQEPQPTAATSSSPIKTTTNFYQYTVPSFNPEYGKSTQGAVVSVAMATPNQSTQPVQSNIAKSKENIVSVPSGLARNLISRPSIRYPHVNDSKLLSSVSHVPNSSGSDPMLAKRTPTPARTMDMTTFLEPDPPSLSSSAIFDDRPSESSGIEESLFVKENRVTSHLSSEHKRRCNLKTGFDLLQQIVPAIAENPKVSKATMLQKTAEYCKKLKTERAQVLKESAILKEEIDSLNSDINTVQAQLPVTGVSNTRHCHHQLTEMFDEYIRVRTNVNSKFWIFSVLMRSMFDSYCNTVSTSSLEELCRTTLMWLEQSCSLVTLRPSVLNALRKLCTSSPILTDPQRMKQHALQVVSLKGKEQRSSNNSVK